MADKEVILRRVGYLEKTINYLRGIENFSKEEFSNDPDIYFRFERAFHLALEAVLDLANHLIADQNLRMPESNRDVFNVLYENNLINKALYTKLEKMAGFRNILVHDYLVLDREREYEIIRSNLDELRKFMELIVDNI